MCRKMPELTPKQSRALLALLSHSTVVAAADAAGVSEKALYGWLREPAFHAEYLAARRDAFSQAIGRLQGMASEGAAVLLAIATDPTKPASARVAAVRTMFEYGTKWIELQELEQRLSALEARLT